MIKNGRPYTIIKSKGGYAVDDKLITDAPLEVQLKVCAWIRRNIIGDAEENSRHTSYGIKHIYGRESRDYLTNNQFKDAMMICGYYPVNENDLNWTYRISECSPAFSRVPFEKQVLRKNGFFAWMMQFTDEDTDRGMLARDMEYDPDFPAPCTHQQGAQYLSEMRACKDFAVEFENAWAEWAGDSVGRME